MTGIDEVRRAIEAGVGTLRLLDHPFYRRWEAGALGRDELGRYAEQYRHFEAAVPSVLERCLATLGGGAARSAVRRNLDDEVNGPRPHVDLFDDFGRSVGARRGAAPSAATVALIDQLERSVDAGPVEALAALLTYEAQSPGVATTKAAALREHYRPSDASFWDVHAAVDDEHANWLIEALAGLDADIAVIETEARMTATRWWAFLEEREAATCT